MCTLCYEQLLRYGANTAGHLELVCYTKQMAPRDKYDCALTSIENSFEMNKETPMKLYLTYSKHLILDNL